MLTIIEVLFFIIGVWGLIKGKLPGRLFRFVFGRGDYNLSLDKARWFALFLILPLPAAFLMGLVLGSLFGQNGVTYAYIFEIVFDLIVITIAAILARKVKQQNLVAQTEMPPVLEGYANIKPMSSSGKFGLRVLLVFFGFIVVTLIGTLVLVLSSFRKYGASISGIFWQDTFPFLIIFVFICGGIAGIVLITKKLKQP